MRTLLITRSLAIGGAERQLVVLAKGLKENNKEVSVLVFYSGGELLGLLEEAGVPVFCLNKKGRWDLLVFFRKYFRIVRDYRPNVIVGILDVPNILALFAKLRWRNIKIVWNFPASNINPMEYGWAAVVSSTFERWLSEYPDLILTNSNAGKDHAIQRGVTAKKITVIPNGFDTQYFIPDTQARKRQRKIWHVDDNEILIGLVGRLDPIKNHPLFIDTCRLLMDESLRFRFVCVGDGPVDYKTGLKDYARQSGVSSKIIWAGVSFDMNAAYNAIDVLTLTSRSEGLPNVLGEAMSCGTPCVVTDVGDARMMVSDLGFVVSEHLPSELVKGIRHVLATKSRLGDGYKNKIRCRILEHFDQDQYIQSTLEAIGYKN